MVHPSGETLYGHERQFIKEHRRKCANTYHGKKMEAMGVKTMVLHFGLFRQSVCLSVSLPPSPPPSILTYLQRDTLTGIHDNI